MRALRGHGHSVGWCGVGPGSGGGGRGDGMASLGHRSALGLLPCTARHAVKAAQQGRDLVPPRAAPEGCPCLRGNVPDCQRTQPTPFPRGCMHNPHNPHTCMVRASAPLSASPPSAASPSPSPATTRRRNSRGTRPAARLAAGSTCPAPAHGHGHTHGGRRQVDFQHTGYAALTRNVHACTHARTAPAACASPACLMQIGTTGHTEAQVYALR